MDMAMGTDMDTDTSRKMTKRAATTLLSIRPHGSPRRPWARPASVLLTSDRVAAAPSVQGAIPGPLPSPPAHRVTEKKLAKSGEALASEEGLVVRPRLFSHERKNEQQRNYNFSFSRLNTNPFFLFRFLFYSPGYLI
jgi:hypothetical protein